MGITCHLSTVRLSLGKSELGYRFFPGGFSGKHVASRSIIPFRCSSVRIRSLKVSEGGDGGDHGGGNGGFGRGSGGSGEGAFNKARVYNLASVLWARYMDSLESHPLVIKSLTAGALNFVADLFCQVFIEKCKSLDIQRLLSFTSIGMFMSGPGMHYWYGMLPKLIRVPGVVGVALRIAVDQLVFTPLGMGSFFIVLCTLEGRPHEIKTKLAKDWLPIVVANWKVWIPFQMLNFGFIPSQLQVAAASLLGVAWSIFISFTGHT